MITQAFEKARIDDYGVDVEAPFETEDLGPDLPEYPDHLSRRYTTIAVDVEVAADEAQVDRLLEPAEHACVVSRSGDRDVGFELDERLTVGADGNWPRSVPGSVDRRRRTETARLLTRPGLSGAWPN